MAIGFASGCSSTLTPAQEEPIPDTGTAEVAPPDAPPSLLTLNVADGAEALPIDTVLRAQFSEVMDEASLQTENFYLESAGVPVAARLEYHGSLVTLTPNDGFNFDASYRLVITAGLRDPGGKVLTNPTEIEFSSESFSSSLPIVILHTGGVNIPDDPKIPAGFRVIYREGEISSLEDPSDFFESAIGIETRGHFSQSFSKKQYGFETADENGEDLKVELFGLPEESDWILSSSYVDRSHLRNYLAFEASRELGRYASRVRFLELFFETGEPGSSPQYRGVYSLLEKIKRDDNRVDIKKLNPEQNAEPQVSGGYIFAIDRFDPGDNMITTSAGTKLKVEYPDPDEISAGQQSWLRNYLDQFEVALLGSNFQDPALGYAAYLDVASAVDYFLINEVFRNPDAYRFSTFLFKDRGGKINFGPIWDMDFSMGNDVINNAASPEGWQHLQAKWIGRLLEDPAFVERVIERYQTLRNGAFSTEFLFEKIDAAFDEINDAQSRNFRRWQVLDFGGFPFPDVIPGSYEGEVDNLKDWLRLRLDWVDAHIENL